MKKFRTVPLLLSLWLVPSLMASSPEAVSSGYVSHALSEAQLISWAIVGAAVVLGVCIIVAAAMLRSGIVILRDVKASARVEPQEQ